MLGASWCLREVAWGFPSLPDPRSAAVRRSLVSIPIFQIFIPFVIHWTRLLRSTWQLYFAFSLSPSWLLLCSVCHSSAIPERKPGKMKLFYCRMFLLTVHLGVSGVIHGHAFTAEVVDLFLEIISRH